MLENKKIVFIVNPISGVGKKDKLPEIVDKEENTKVNIPILNPAPPFRIVATAADATEVSFGGTEPIMTFVFGGENSPKPIP